MSHHSTPQDKEGKEEEPKEGEEEEGQEEEEEEEIGEDDYAQVRVTSQRVGYFGAMCGCCWCGRGPTGASVLAVDCFLSVWHVPSHRCACLVILSVGHILSPCHVEAPSSSLIACAPSFCSPLLASFVLGEESSLSKQELHPC